MCNVKPHLHTKQSIREFFFLQFFRFRVLWGQIFLVCNTIKHKFQSRVLKSEKLLSGDMILVRKGEPWKWQLACMTNYSFPRSLAKWSHLCWRRTWFFLLKEDKCLYPLFLLSERIWGGEPLITKKRHNKHWLSWLIDFW